MRDLFEPPTDDDFESYGGGSTWPMLAFCALCIAGIGLLIWLGVR